MSEDLKTLLTITSHVRRVQRVMLRIAREIERRAAEHDLSKLSADEFEGFVQINRVAREHKYGSPEYKSSLDAVEPNPIKLHYSRNSHHPEHYPGGVEDMDLFDLIEMVCDWKAASETYGNTSFSESVEISCKRFGLNDAQVYLVELVAKAIEGGES